MKRLWEFSRFIEIVALFGLLLYVAQSWSFANSQDSIGDEGAYLYKGYMFARGDYRPFQENAFWTNKSPLAFLIPGYIQLWFGPGLREARYFAVLVGALMVMGVWVTARRLGGRVWAAIMVWVFALSSPQIVIYSEAVSQGLIACMIAWMLALTLGKDRPLWQLLLGSALSVLIVMTRQNIVVLPVMLVPYIFWQHGKKAGIASLATCAVLFLGFHLYYWPNILQLWAPWLPEPLTPFLDPFRIPMDYEQTYASFVPTVLSISQSFATGMRDNFFVFFGSLSALVLFPKRALWKNDDHFKMAVFLGVTFLLLVIMHTLASLFVSYCVYCFSGYQMFFTVLGFFFVLVVFLNGFDTSRTRQILLFIGVILFAAILGLYYHPQWGGWLLTHIQLPRVNRMFTRGEFSFVSLQDVLYHSLKIVVPDVQERMVGLTGGVFLGGVLWFALALLSRFLLQKNWMPKYGFVNLVLFCCLAFGTLYPFSASVKAPSNPCSARYITYYEQAGRSLAQLVPPGSQLYWKGSGKHLALMLYLNDVKIFPAQIHAGGGYVVGDTKQLPRFGMFNQELDTQWRDSAEVLVVWEENMSPDLLEFLQQQPYEQVQYDMGELARCEDALFVFRRGQ
jgi:hypothetical protein